MTDKTTIRKLRELSPSLISLCGKSEYSYSDEQFDYRATVDTFLETLNTLELPKDISDALDGLKDFIEKADNHRENYEYLKLLGDMAEEWRDNKKPEMVCYGCDKVIDDTVHWIDELPFCEECSDTPVFFSDERENLMRQRYASQYKYGANGK